MAQAMPPVLPVLDFGSVSPASLASLPTFSIPVVEPIKSEPALSAKGRSSCSFERSSSQHSVSADDNDDEPVHVLPDLKFVARSVLKAKRIAVVCGAGISCASGIPDFRSSEGLFETLKRQHPEAKLSSGKDLFDASLFSSETNAALFYNMIAELKTMADQAQPTKFHQYLKMLDDEGKLFRVYTQNIDGLEEKVGLTYGLGDTTQPLPPRRKTASTTSALSSPSKSQSKSQSRSESFSRPNAAEKRLRSVTPSPCCGEGEDEHRSADACPSSSPPTPPSQSASPPPTSIFTENTIPRCIPLHGHLATLSCPHCSHTIPITPHLSLLASGTSPLCPQCVTIDSMRSSLGERSRGVGRLKPDVVLYGETHRQGERVGEITNRDLMGVRPDLLLVVGTSLKVPGTKLLVRELAKVIRPSPSTRIKEALSAKLKGKGCEGMIKERIDEEDQEEEDQEANFPVASGSSTISNVSLASSSATVRPTRKPVQPKAEPIKVIYLNYDFPKPSAEWKDVFDLWLRGDAQEFVDILEQEKARELSERETNKMMREERAKRKEERKVLKRAREEELLNRPLQQDKINPTSSSQSPRKRQKKVVCNPESSKAGKAIGTVMISPKRPTAKKRLAKKKPNANPTNTDENVLDGSLSSEKRKPSTGRKAARKALTNQGADPDVARAPTKKKTLAKSPSVRKPKSLVKTAATKPRPRAIKPKQQTLNGSYKTTKAFIASDADGYKVQEG